MNEVKRLEQRLGALEAQLAEVESQGIQLPEGALIPADTPVEKTLEVASRLAVEELAIRQQAQASELMKQIAVGTFRRSISDVQADLDDARRAEIAVKVEACRVDVRKKQREINSLCGQLSTLIAEVKTIAASQQAQNEFYNSNPPSTADFFQQDRRTPITLPELQEQPGGSFLLTTRPM